MKKNNIQMPTNRNFGVVFFIFFLVIALYPILNDENIRYWSVLIAVIFLILGIFNSKFLSPLNKLWMNLGLFLGRIISPIVMGLVFFLVVTPTSLILKIFKKDVLNLKKNKNETYWIKRETRKGSMRNQF